MPIGQRLEAPKTKAGQPSANKRHFGFHLSFVRPRNIANQESSVAKVSRLPHTRLNWPGVLEPIAGLLLLHSTFRERYEEVLGSSENRRR